MNQIKLRLEMHLEAGDLVSPGDALALALQGLAGQWEAMETSPTHAVVEVPRGRAAYVAEVSYGRRPAKVEEPDDGN
jgi:hypothetical protein